MKAIAAAAVVACGSVAGCGVSLGESAESGLLSFDPGMAPEPASAGSQDNDRFAILLNDERGGVMAQPITINQTLTDVAQAHATDMAQNGYFSHVGLNGSTISDRVSASGYQYDWVAENLLQGTTDEAVAVQTWMQSAPHRDAMLEPRAEEFGLGLDADLYVLILADPAD
ncbi:CAP domain-containing protein [Flavimaricola marinus]|uniref:Cysteine-rich secretory protein family protein n=1 Tax=Flavimaricola marinus TaxID=1819565 RepID=A0A238LFR0_9RHOB|nr:CAP domain-containing protein [Flavimaricola marinus]SMY08557.1 Cysteine-rich secretory protein family protein [Flavimaricola marinus]